MGIYAKKIEDMFRALPEIENTLQKYDNVTYHIQFFMVPAKIQFAYSKLRAQINEQALPVVDRTAAILNADKQLYNNRIIIAESGVTNNINIDSLSMITHPPASSETFGATTVEMDLKMTEINSSSLVNKIALASYLCGYESYCYQQYFISVWFTGYDASTGKPIDKIPLSPDGSIKQCTYQVCMGDVKTSSESNKTTYNIKLYPSFFNSLSKEVNVLSNLGEVKLTVGDTFEDYIKQLEKRINEHLFHQYTKTVIDEVYKGLPPLEIEVDKSLSLKKSYATETYEKKKETNLAYFNDKINNIDPSSSSFTAGAKGLMYGMFQAVPIVYNYFSNTLPYNSSKTITFVPEQSDTIISAIHKLSSHYNIHKTGSVLTVKYDNLYVGDYNNVSYYKHKILIGSAVVPGLQDIQDVVIGKQKPTYTERPSTFQENYLNTLQAHKLLQKKYYWLYNGKNTNVLSIKTEEDNMWYLNLGLTDLYAIQQNIPEVSYKEPTEEESMNFYNQVSPADYKAIVEKDLSINNTFYIDDIYQHFVKNKNKSIDLSTWYKISKSNSPLTDLPASAAVINEEKDASDLSDVEKLKTEMEIRYRLGMENIFQVTNQKMKLDLDILGDPYWMFFGDSTDDSASQYLVLPHLLLFQRSFHEADGYDNYEEDKLMEYNSLYTITKIVSNFENGTFKQRISGFVATPFLQSSKFENSITTSEQSDNKRASTIHQTSDGKIIAQK